jgi:translation initiation factor IF-2
MKEEKNNRIIRPPVIVIMGHVDHGKSKLLDYIRKSNVVESEAGGITQHISAYEVSHKDSIGKERIITFLDTPGHEAFQKMRVRGTTVADIAVLVVSAQDGVKAQTLEALSSVKDAGIPFIVAINKIDLPSADIERTKQDLLKHEIYLEGLGGDVPWTAISASVGTGVEELLDLMLLVADLEEITGEPEKEATGVVIESHSDPKKGISATLVIKNGTLRKGMCISAGSAISPVRIMENFKGDNIEEATFSSPVRVVGFNTLPEVGVEFVSYKSKKEAEIFKDEKSVIGDDKKKASSESKDDMYSIPIVLKADVAGTLDAILHELEKLRSTEVDLKVIHKGVGTISEGDIKTAGGKAGTLVIGFNTNVDSLARDMAERREIEIQTFDVIYKLSEWLEGYVAEHKPKEDSGDTTGTAKIVKVFSKSKNKQVLGGNVIEGEIALGQHVRIHRRGELVGEGEISNIQQSRVNAKSVSKDSQFGTEIKSKIEIVAGDTIESIAGKRLP